MCEFRVATPASWFDLDLDPATRTASVERLVAERGAGDAARLAGMLEHAAADAASQGAMFASMFSDVVSGRPVSASLVVSLVDATAGKSASGDERALLAEGLRQAFAGDGGASEVRSLSAGPATRVRRRLRVEPPEGFATAADVELLQYFVPHPGGDRLALLSFSTPSLGLAEGFVELFDAIASTFEWRR